MLSAASVHRWLFEVDGGHGPTQWTRRRVEGTRPSMIDPVVATNTARVSEKVTQEKSSSSLMQFNDVSRPILADITQCRTVINAQPSHTLFMQQTCHFECWPTGSSIRSKQIGHLPPPACRGHLPSTAPGPGDSARPGRLTRQRPERQQPPWTFFVGERVGRMGVLVSCPSCSTCSPLIVVQHRRLRVGRAPRFKRDSKKGCPRDQDQAHPLHQPAAQPPSSSLHHERARLLPNPRAVQRPSRRGVPGLRRRPDSASPLPARQPAGPVPPDLRPAGRGIQLERGRRRGGDGGPDRRRRAQRPRPAPRQRQRDENPEPGPEGGRAAGLPGRDTRGDTGGAAVSGHDPGPAAHRDLSGCKYHRNYLMISCNKRLDGWIDGWVGGWVYKHEDGQMGTVSKGHRITVEVELKAHKQTDATAFARIRGRAKGVPSEAARPGMSVRIVPPPPSDSPSLDRPRQPQRMANSNERSNEKKQMFEVIVPEGVYPGQPFALLAGGVRVLVTCPKNAAAGQKIRFSLPIGLVKLDGPKSKLAEIKLSYDKDGWTRTIRASDMKFQWTRFDENGGVDTVTSQRFDDTKSAYVLKLDFHDDHDKMRHGSVSLVTPEKGFVDSNIESVSGQELVSYQDIANAQNKSYEDKIQWFQETREYLLSDSMEAVMSLSRKDLRKVWRFEFIGEAGIDVGGLAREWFELVTDEVFDPDMGLWQTSATNQMCMQINPASGEFISYIACPEDHLIYFRFIGRIMGKAMFDRQLVKGHMVKHLYKHILGWPVMFSDLKDIDEEYYNSLKGLKDMKDMGENIECLCADFTTTEETFGGKRVVELVPGGADIEVTEENLPEYIEASLKHRLLGRYEKQLNELLLGFFDVIPKPLLTIFDFQELELLMCGLPEIDMDNWKENTEYSGDYDREGPNHEVCGWFWEVVSEYDQELKARLLQFVTGTSGVPANGFGSLQGNNGDVRRFTIHGVALETCVYPRSHTCFNRIDLPIYDSKDELEEKLKIAITMAATGFDIE
ncbi:hypothetical protein THAOC_18147 [Thalassiosira oceanica]|uniref:HECT-type E3 ubiquitin transferase n=1 Tax=Thalassiosira oceanica TaxID=159749 RepID=K0S8U4_THAOC|nr:hypothetical protein THAOC_18147 [Thalassiosira oceanica]|eukprot:EJK61369.1 hypothetical protein THAOC_18147 [Thalassiosira oceanica]